jgi:hypothetical protein
VLITLANRLTSAAMVALFCLFLALFASPFKSKSRLEAENAALRHQLLVLKRRDKSFCDRRHEVTLFGTVGKATTTARPEQDRWDLVIAALPVSSTAHKRLETPSTCGC